MAALAPGDKVVVIAAEGWYMVPDGGQPGDVGVVVSELRLVPACGDGHIRVYATYAVDFGYAVLEVVPECLRKLPPDKGSWKALEDIYTPGVTV